MPRIRTAKKHRPMRRQPTHTAETSKNSSVFAKGHDPETPIPSRPLTARSDFPILQKSVLAPKQPHKHP